MVAFVVIAGVIAGTYIVATNIQIERQKQETYNAEVLKKKSPRVRDRWWE